MNKRLEQMTENLLKESAFADVLYSPELEEVHDIIERLHDMHHNKTKLDKYNLKGFSNLSKVQQKLYIEAATQYIKGLYTLESLGFGGFGEQIEVLSSIVKQYEFIN